MVCQASFHFSESKVELDEVGVKDELDKAKVDIAGVGGKFMVAGVNGTLKDESTSKNPKEEQHPYHVRYTPATV